MSRAALQAFGAMVLLAVSGVGVAAEHPAVSREMAGVWSPDGRRSTRAPAQPPLTEVGRKAAEEYRARHEPIDFTVDDANASCVPESMPYASRLMAQYPFELLFTPDRLTIFVEIYGSVRRIPIGQPAPRFETLPTAMGRSQARWEGDTLVVETTDIRRAGAGLPSGNPPVSNARRIVERITLGRDENGAKQLRNEVTVHDPIVFAAPVSSVSVYRSTPELEVGEYLCQQDIWDQNIQGSPSSVPWRQ